MESTRDILIEEIRVEKTAIETDPLLGSSHANVESWWDVGKRYTNQALAKIKNTSMAGLAFAAALPNTINSLVAPINALPSELIKKSFWQTLSVPTILHMIANGTAALLVNLILNLFFLPLSIKKFYRNITHFKENPWRNLISLFLGFTGALGAGAIAYGAFDWFPGTFFGEIFAASAALINFIIYIATRYVSVSDALERFFNLFDIDIQTQEKFADQLDHLNTKYQPEINRIYDAIKDQHLSDIPNHPITQTDIDTITKSLAIALNQYAATHPDLFLDKTKCELFINGLLTFIDLVFAGAIISVPVTLTFLDAGFRGISKLGELIGGNNLKFLNIWIKRLLGSSPCIASGVMYTLSAYDLRKILVAVAKKIYKNPTPKQIVLAAVLLIANILSTSSMQNVGTNIIKDPNNIVFMKDNTLGQLFMIGDAAGGLAVNAKASFKKSFLSDPLTVETIDSVNNLANLLHSTDHCHLNKEVTQHLRTLSLFKEKPPPSSSPSVNPTIDHVASLANI